MNSVGDAFGYPFRDSEWLGKIAVQGLIFIIPIVGWIAGLGWMMMNFDNFRAGRQQLAPAGFHLDRGIGIFGVLFIYTIVANLPAWILDAAGAAASRAVSYTSTSYYTGSPLSGLGSLLGLAAQLLVDFLLPSLIVMTYHHGFSGGLDVQRVWGLATRNVSNSVIAGALLFVTSIISALGLVACCIGVIFTIAYGLAVQAGIAAWFERVQATPAAPAAPAA